MGVQSQSQGPQDTTSELVTHWRPFPGTAELGLKPPVREGGLAVTEQDGAGIRVRENPAPEPSLSHLAALLTPSLNCRVSTGPGWEGRFTARPAVLHLT